ncbi:glycosyltransferase [Thiohalocapsa sp. ML1]|uniref:glycosyltransferase n=1 Tax=Thiohalocapsa sp. ML1 TaxID=1431688 RepID=UPI0007322CAF|nr:glycosyltransferase [Thiohalocapsa sp. ML1]
MAKPSIAIITASYPYPPGEQFLEAEAPYWPTADFGDVYILPRNTEGTPRPLPQGITLDLALRQPSKAIRIAYLVPALLSAVFFREIKSLVSANRFSVQRALSALFETRNTLLGAAQIARFCKRNGAVDIAYCYWNDSMAYACCLAKQRGLCRRVVSRAHGVDLYEERARGRYMPLKRQFLAYFDRIFVLSNEACNYFLSRYGASAAQLAIAPLGVSIPRQTCDVSPPGQLHVLSVSFCVPVKRMDRIIAALAHLAATHPQLSIHWTHIGDGPLCDEMRSAAARCLGPLANVEFAFLGHQANAAVRQLYEEHPVDVFVNTSESEGVPVSIMEAMGYGVPAVAPDVGGVSSLVVSGSGALIAPDACAQVIGDALLSLRTNADRMQFRARSKQFIREHFNAALNYPRVLAEISAIASRDPSRAQTTE